MTRHAIKVHRALLLGSLVLGTACSSSRDPAGVPAVDPTHHAMVSGTVLNQSGAPLVGIRVGTLSAESIPPNLQVTTTGGSITDESGEYRFESLSSAPRSSNGTAQVFVSARRTGVPGQAVVEDSTLVTVYLRPRGQPPLSLEVPPIVLPVDQ